MRTKQKAMLRELYSDLDGLAKRLKGIARLVGYEAPDEMNNDEDFSEAREGIGCLLEDLASTARRLATSVDEMLVNKELSEVEKEI